MKCEVVFKNFSKNIWSVKNMFEIFPTLGFMIFPPTDLIFSGFLWFVINVWCLFGPAEFAIAAIIGAISFAWIITLPYLSLSLIKYISKN
jgi:hypothetical protein